MVIQMDTRVQDTFLEEAQRQQTPVVLYVTNGFQIRGTIANYDEVSILVNSNGEQKLVFKRALSTIGPDKEETPKPRYQSRSW